MPKHDETRRRTGKNSRKNTFNKYGKNTRRGLRHMMAARTAQVEKQKNQQKNKN